MRKKEIEAKIENMDFSPAENVADIFQRFGFPRKLIKNNGSIASPKATISLHHNYHIMGSRK